MVMTLCMYTARPETAALNGYGLKSERSSPDAGEHFSLNLNVYTCLILVTPITFGYSMCFFSMTLMKTVRCFMTNGTATR